MSTSEVIVYAGESVPAPPVDDLGPNMLALNERQRRFVCALFLIGANWNHNRAAMMAGYNGNAATLQVTAHRLIHDPKVQAAIHEESLKRLSAGKVMAVSNLIEIIADKTHKDNLKATLALLNRSGLHETTEHRVSVERRVVPDKEVLEKVFRLGQANGFTQAQIRQMLGPNASLPALPAPAEAEFVELSSEGLEDIL